MCHTSYTQSAECMRTAGVIKKSAAQGMASATVAPVQPSLAQQWAVIHPLECNHPGMWRWQPLLLLPLAVPGRLK